MTTQVRDPRGSDREAEGHGRQPSRIRPARILVILAVAGAMLVPVFTAEAAPQKLNFTARPAPAHATDNSRKGPRAKPTATPTATLAPTASPGATSGPSATATPAPTATATPAATSVPTTAPTATPAPTPTADPTTAPVVDPPTVVNRFVTTCGTGLCRAGAPWYLYGASMLSGLDNPSTVAGMAVAAHVNTLRIVNFLDEGGSVTTAPYDEGRWQRVDRAIAAAGQANLTVLLDLSTYRNLLKTAGLNPYAVDWTPFIRFVTSRVNTVTGATYASDPTIAMIAFAGEVDPINTSSNSLGVTTTQLTSFYRTVFATWTSFDAHHLLETGGLLQLDWNSGIDWKTIMALPGNDVCSLHDYSTADEQTTTPMVATYCASIGKAWITEEFGWEQSLGDATRASAFRVMHALNGTYGSAGEAFWNLGGQTSGSTYDVNGSTPMTWSAILADAPGA